MVDILCFTDLVLLREAVTFMSLIQAFGGDGNPMARYLERKEMLLFRTLKWQ